MLKNPKSKFWTFFSVGMWFWIQSTILLSVGGYLIYVYDSQNQNELSKISEYQFWNTKKNVLTFEGKFPRLFIDNINKLTDEEIKIKIDSKKVLDYRDFSDNYVYISKNSLLFKKQKQENENNKQLYNTYLIKNKQDLVDLIALNQGKSTFTTNEFFLKSSVKKDVDKLFETIDLSKKDVIILNNYVSQLFGIWGDRREKGLNLVDFSFNEKTKTIKLNWKFQDYRKRSAINQAIGSYDWFKSYFLVIDKNKINNLDSISFESAFS
ncbi:hypothetical protein [Mycoplasma sp. 'Moose RK']|uniref:hypothetical protein n=1 Tax=Mycoplasma sp. 'Moose RK' TaxID=2780095 RepID=UPI0018C34E5D|nr:hypothetical protein [Mycoplasma sp. 'Moose RK']MBG0730764.1 hypothetical protein [Mycoplasma sp. 'Moose RK']